MKKPQLNRFFSPIDFLEARLDLLHDGYIYFNEVKQATFIDADENEVETKSIIKNKPKIAEVKSDKNVLDEVIIVNYNKKNTYSIIDKVIQNIDKNYPILPFSSSQNTNIDVKVADKSVTNFDLINKQFDFGYDQSSRNSKQLEEIKWNIKTDYQPTNIRQFRSLTYNNPIMYCSFLNSRKSKKFAYKIIEVKNYNNKMVYVINFSTQRNHYSYTQRQIPANYSGTLFIDKNDFAVVKVFENWQFIENPEPTKFDMFGWNEKFVSKELRSEILETNFEKINNSYFLTNSDISIFGKLFDKDKNSYKLEMSIHSTWDNFQTANPIKIPYKNEIELFDKIKFNDAFWQNYKSK